MDAKNFLITCCNCKGHSRIKIINNTEVLYLDHTPIIAVRFRPDMKWGFECLCGNDTRLAPQEVDQADMLVAGSSKDVIQRIVDAATDKPEHNFRMEPA
jgi:hypothetical protein